MVPTSILNMFLGDEKVKTMRNNKDCSLLVDPNYSHHM